MAKERIGDTDILKMVMKRTGTTQIGLRDALHYKSQSAVSGRLNTPNIGVKTFAALLNAMNYEVIVREIVNDDDSDDEIARKNGEALVVALGDS